MKPASKSAHASTAAKAAAAQNRIAHLASLTAIHRAFHWLHLHQPQIRQWQLDLVRIPAPSFGEAPRAAWFLDRFHELGLSNVHLDPAGNALAELAPTTETCLSEGPASPDLSHKNPVISTGARNSLIVPRGAERPPYFPSASPTTPQSAKSAGAPRILLSAHLDTVFPTGTPCEPTATGTRIYAPGICDNAAGLSALLAIAAALRYANIAPPTPVLFAANVGEEGEGDLRGMKHLFSQGEYRDRIATAIILEGSGSSAAVTRALGSIRFRLTITGPGGHSWTDAGAPNPILLLSQALTRLASIPLPDEPRTTLNVGHISGGTSINSIPQSASALLDLRSADPGQLQESEDAIRQALDSFGTTFTTQKSILCPAKLQLEIVGNRPAAALPSDSPLLHTLRAVDRHLTLRTEPRLASTDANIPLSINIPAIAIGSGGLGGGIHTLQEWYDPTGRETALRRVLLTLLDTVQTIEN